MRSKQEIEKLLLLIHFSREVYKVRDQKQEPTMHQMRLRIFVACLYVYKATVKDISQFERHEMNTLNLRL